MNEHGQPSECDTQSPRLLDATPITAPAEGTAVAEGATITVSWTGKTDYNPDMAATGLFGATVKILAYDATANSLVGIPVATGDATANPTGSSAQLTVPSSTSGYLVELDVSGKYVIGAQGVGLCSLVRRVHLKKQ